MGERAARPRTTLLRAARAVDADGAVDDAWILIAGDVIAATGSGSQAPDADSVEDLGQATLVPGFIDLHGHGGAQGAYDDGVDETRAALRMHRSHGTTRSVLSLVANPVESLAESLSRIADLHDADPLVLGAHLEGPFLSPDNRGAHNHDHLRTPTPAMVDELLAAGRGTVRQVTIAPELDGAIDAISRFAAAGVVAAVGHTVATAETTARAFDAGARLLTHAFNAMPGIHHRRPGPIPVALGDPRVSLELILDGVHVHPSVASILFAAADGRVALITDAMAAAGAEDGAYMLGSMAVSVTKGVAHLAGTDTIAGSTLTQDLALRNAVRRVGLPLDRAVAALTSAPASVLGMEDQLGRLRSGFAADVLALDADLAVRQVWAAGTLLQGRGGVA